jgi:hypothetical protein
MERFMKYLTILKTALVLFKHTFQHLSKEDVKYGDIINVDLTWTIKRIPNEKT